MPSQNFAIRAAPKHASFSLVLFFLLFASTNLYTTTADSAKITRIGATIDVDSRIGRQQEIAIKIAAQNFNQSSKYHKLAIDVRNSSKDPIQATHAVEELIKGKQVEVIIGMETWQEAALVVEVGNRAQVPVLSFAAAATTLPLAQLRWPFLVQMAANFSGQMDCVGAIIRSYNWRKVIPVYEEDMFGGGPMMLALLSEALQDSGSEIEHRLVFPPFSSLSDPDGFIYKKMTELVHKQSRVFVILQSSFSLVMRLFEAANEMGFMGKDSVWIMADSVSSLLNSANSSVVSSMRGALGIEAYYPDDSSSFLAFKSQFQQQFRLEYPNEDDSRPGIHALRAYDSVSAIARALENLVNTEDTTSKVFLESILSSNFTGLSGDVCFQDGQLTQRPVFRIINFIGKTYNELGFWSPNFGFTEGLVVEQNGRVINSSGDAGGSMKTVFADSVKWPGKLRSVPTGWAMPTDISPMKIGVPGRTSFEKFVKVDWNGDSNRYTGFCIEVFERVLEIIEQKYPLPYEFHPFNGTYDELVDNVINGTFDAVVGDVTILANRSRYVEFTQPFAESGLLMVVPVKQDGDQGWLFVKPFNKQMWLVTGLVMVYTTLIVWFLEHQSNPEFSGPWRNQLSTALWFTFCSLFFTQREKIQSNYSRVVVAMWLFVVFVVTSGYQASLTSMLTVPRLEPNVTDIGWLLRTKATVGCDGDSFVKNYLINVLDFSPNNIRSISSQYNYPDEFQSGNITAAFLELPYEKIFLKEYCHGYTVSGPTYRFGGLGFVFQKGSPIADDVSEAILIMSENGKLKSLEEQWFTFSTNCSSSQAAGGDRLGLQSFWGLYIISGATSTLCLLFFFLLRLLRKYRTEGANIAGAGNLGFWEKLIPFFLHSRRGGTVYPGEAPTLGPIPRLDTWGTARWELVSPSEIPADLEVSRPTEIEMPVQITSGT